MTSPSQTISSVALCGSMKVLDQMSELVTTLRSSGKIVFMPEPDEPANYRELPLEQANRAKHVMMTDYLKKISQVDAVLVVNLTIGDKVNYIGPNSFLEMGFALALGKKILLLNEIPDQPNSEEIAGMLPTILRGDLSLIT